MGAVDLVVQVESPGSVSRGLQRIGRAGHQVGEPSRGKIFPKYRGDLLEAAAVVPADAGGARRGDALPAQPARRARPADRRDVRARRVGRRRACRAMRPARRQLRGPDRRRVHRGARSAGRPVPVRRVRRAAAAPRVGPRRRPRARRATARSGVAVTNGGTIPDRGLFGVFLPDGTRVGELDEEMVYESRPGETFVLGASTWRIEEITLRPRDRSHRRPGEPGKMPFWHGDRPGRPLELGRAFGAYRARAARRAERAGARTTARRVRPRRARRQQPRSSTSPSRPRRPASLPDDRTVVVERFRDEIGDWRVCVLSPFGSRVHAPWALALEVRLAERLDLEVEVLWSDDGIVLRLPEAVEQIPVEELLIDPDEVEDLVVRQLPATALFASRFREAAARALLLPRRRPGRTHTVVAAAPARRRPARRRGARTPTSRCCSRRRANVCATSSTSPRCARCCAICGRARSAWSRSRPGRRRRSRSRCCSDGSPSTCTKATPHSRSGARPRSPSTAICSASCSVPTSCASCSTPTRSPSSSSSCNASLPAGGARATSTTSTTSCATSETSPTASSRRVSTAGRPPPTR